MVHVIVGLVFVTLGAWGIIEWWDDFGEVLRGLVPLLIALWGLAALGAGFQKTRNAAEHEDEDSEEPSAETLARP